MDSAGRTFGLLALGSLFAFVLTAMGACLLLSILSYRAATDGLLTAIGDPAFFPAVAFLLAVGAGVVLAAVSLRRQARSSRILARRVRALELPLTPALRAIVTRTHLGGRLVLVDSDAPFSFVFGAFRPRIAVSHALVETATPAELDAVIEHERYHVRNLDPLRISLARALPMALFYVPALSQLRERYVARRELAADRHALRRYGRAPLAGALFKVLRAPEWPELATAAAMGGTELLDARITQLETGREPSLGGISRRAAVSSVVSGTVLAIGFGAAAAGLGWTPDMRGGMDVPVAGAFMVAACAAPWAFGGFLAWIAVSGHRTAR